MRPLKLAGWNSHTKYAATAGDRCADKIAPLVVCVGKHFDSAGWAAIPNDAGSFNRTDPRWRHFGVSTVQQPDAGGKIVADTIREDPIRYSAIHHDAGIVVVEYAITR